MWVGFQMSSVAGDPLSHCGRCPSRRETVFLALAALGSSGQGRALGGGLWRDVEAKGSRRVCPASSALSGRAGESPRTSRTHSVGCRSALTAELLGGLPDGQDLAGAAEQPRRHQSLPHYVSAIHPSHFRCDLGNLHGGTLPH